MTATTSWTSARWEQDFQYHRKFHWAIGSSDDPWTGRSDALGPRQIFSGFEIS